MNPNFNPTLATHMDEKGGLYIVSKPGHEDGTIGIWSEGSWVTAETSGAFEQTLISLGKPDIDTMVNRFLTWQLPADVCADPCVTKLDWPSPRYGTNLLNANQARELFAHLLGGAQ